MAVSYFQNCALQNPTAFNQARTADSITKHHPYTCDKETIETP